MINSFLYGQRLCRHNDERSRTLSGIKIGYYVELRYPESGYDYESVQYNYENLSWLIDFLKKIYSADEYKEGIYSIDFDLGHEITELMSKIGEDDYYGMKKYALQKMFPREDLLDICHAFSSRKIFELMQDFNKKKAKLLQKRDKFKGNQPLKTRVIDRRRDLEAKNNIDLLHEKENWRDKAIVPFYDEKAAEDVQKVKKILFSSLPEDHGSFNDLYSIYSHIIDTANTIREDPSYNYSDINDHLKRMLGTFARNMRRAIDTATTCSMLETMFKKEMEKLEKYVPKNI